MEKYKIIINHTVAYQYPVVVEANDEFAAKEKVEDMFFGDDDFKKKVLSSLSDFSETQIVFDSIVSDDDNETPLVRLKPNAILKRRLKQEDFSVRTWNCLIAADIKTLGDMISYSRLDYLRLRSLGKKSLTEIEDYVTQFGFSLKKYR